MEGLILLKCPKIHMEAQKTLNNQSNLEQKLQNLDQVLQYPTSNYIIEP
jgi:hypothetical protein